LALTPHNKVTISAAYTLPFDEKVGKVTLGATFTHTDGMRSNFADRNFTTTGLYVDGPSGPVLSHADLGWIQPTNLLDLNVNWNSVGGLPVDLSFFVTNVTGEKYYTFTPGLLGYNSLDTTNSTGSGPESANVGAPRMLGGRIKVHF
jgi:iron complex outermembrane receptor protein